MSLILKTEYNVTSTLQFYSTKLTL